MRTENGDFFLETSMPGIAEEGEGTKEPEVSSDFIDMGTAEVEILRCTFVSASADNSTRSKKIAPKSIVAAFL